MWEFGLDWPFLGYVCMSLRAKFGMAVWVGSAGLDLFEDENLAEFFEFCG
jgi:hypothetical protein